MQTSAASSAVQRHARPRPRRPAPRRRRWYRLAGWLVLWAVVGACSAVVLFGFVLVVAPQL
jgi:hypothetical protein